MATVIELPKLSDTMEEGGIANWLKKEGDAVAEGEPLVEIETDKATQEYESPAEGILLKILVQPGKTIKLRTPIAVVGEKGESIDLAKLTASTTGASAAGASKDKPAAGKSDAPVKLVKEAPTASKSTASKPTTSSAPQQGASEGGRIKSSPLARKVASDRGINLSGVQGSGPGGRVVLRDLDGAVSGGASPKGRVVATQEDQLLPLTMMRKTIAKRLLAAKNDAPHFYLTVSVNMARSEEWRQRLNAAAAKDAQLSKVSVNDLVIMAAARALRLHPGINSSWQGENILQFGSVHVAMAVALPTGLVTPVVRHTDQLGIREIARQTRELAGKAKDGKLSNDDFSGGTFTISNLGMFGIEEFTAIINPPQAAILAVGATIPTPWVDDKGQVVAQPRMKMTLSCDHRVIDGALGAQFLQTLVSYLEDPLVMLG